MEINDKKLIELTPELHDYCLDYMRSRKVSEKTTLLYKDELNKIFKHPILTQTLYNKTHSKGNYYRSVLKLIIDTCNYNDIPTYNYKSIKAIKKKQRIPQCWTEEEIIKMINNIEDYSLFVECAYYIGAGLRFSSALMLSWDDFIWSDWVNDKTKTGKCNIRAKGDKYNILIVDPILMNHLYNIAESKGKMFHGIPYKNSSEDMYLFIKKSSLDSLEELFRKQNFENILDSNKEQVNVKNSARLEIIRKNHYLVDYKLRKLSKFFNGKHIKFHSIRSSRATNLLKKGFKLYTISKQLMHESIATTEIYLSLSNVDIEDEFNEKL